MIFSSAYFIDVVGTNDPGPSASTLSAVTSVLDVRCDTDLVDVSVWSNRAYTTAEKAFYAIRNAYQATVSLSYVITSSGL